MKMKQENMVKGIVYLKKYMYESLSESDKKKNEAKLSNLDQVICNLNKSIESNREDYKTKVDAFNVQSVQKVDSVAQMIEDSLSKISGEIQQGSESKLSYLTQIRELRSEVDALRKQNQELQASEHIEIAERQRQIISDQEKHQDNNTITRGGLDVEKVANVLQKSIDLLMIMDQGNSD